MYVLRCSFSKSTFFLSNCGVEVWTLESYSERVKIGSEYSPGSSFPTDSTKELLSGPYKRVWDLQVERRLETAEAGRRGESRNET